MFKRAQNLAFRHFPPSCLTGTPVSFVSVSISISISVKCFASVHKCSRKFYAGECESCCPPSVPAFMHKRSRAKVTILFAQSTTCRSRPSVLLRLTARVFSTTSSRRRQFTGSHELFVLVQRSFGFRSALRCALLRLEKIRGKQEWEMTSLNTLKKKKTRHRLSSNKKPNEIRKVRSFC